MGSLEGVGVMPLSSMIIDREMPVFDVRIAAHLIVDAPPDVVLRAARELDFTTVRTPLLATAMWARGVPDRLRGRAAEPPRRLVLAEGVGLPGWLMLGETDDEVAFGAVGRFWKPSIEWRDVDRSEFAGFAETGWGRIACNFSVRDYGATRTLLSYECRTATTDAESRRRFANYWIAIKPFVAHIMRATVHNIGNAAQQPTAEGVSERKFQ